MDEFISTDYRELLGDIKSRIRIAQYEALRTVNKALIDLYWNIGKMIVERQQGESWGRSIVEKLSPLVREIGWTHNTIILMNCKDDLEREFYVRMTKAQGWSKNVLIHQIENQTYQKR